jgi:hypothetical protein
MTRPPRQLCRGGHSLRVALTRLEHVQGGSVAKDFSEFLMALSEGRCTSEEWTIFPDRSEVFIQLARKLGWEVAGPQHAFLVQGDDSLGALADIQRMLFEADVEIYASSGVTDGNGHYGYVIYFKEEDNVRAARALGAVRSPEG